MRVTAMWWWIDRWRKSTAYTDMTLEEQGAYRNLLDEQTLRGGPIPNNERILGKACGDALAWPSVREAVLTRFELVEGGWLNRTCEDVRTRSLAIAEKRSQAGAQGNVARWGHRKAIANASQNVSQLVSLPDPDPDPDPEVRTPPRAREPSQPTDFTDEQNRRAGEFCERFAEMHQRFRAGARYLSKPNLDFLEALQLVRLWDDARLDMLAEVFLRTDDEWVASSSRSIARFRSRASWCDDKIAAYEAEKGRPIRR